MQSAILVCFVWDLNYEPTERLLKLFVASAIETREPLSQNDAKTSQYQMFM